MDIYLLRDGKEIGPFSEEATQSFLEQGMVVLDDLAWTPGLPSWSPLVEVIYPQAASVEEPVVEETSEVALEEIPEPAIEEIPEPVEEPKPVVMGELATPKQMAFLSYLGVAFTGKTTKEEAAVLVNEAMENPRMAPRVHQWNDDRLRLHPEIYAEEAQAKKEARASHYFDACEREGADFLTGVTKAHCQVLVGYLDVSFPNWEANEATAARSYFFPAVAEKFPQLVHKDWHGKLKYPDIQTVATDRSKSDPARRSNRGPTPVGALIRGAVFGLALLLVLYVGAEMFTGEPAEQSTAPSPAPAPAPVIVQTEPVKSAVVPVSEIEKPPAPAPADVPAGAPADPPAADPMPVAETGARTHVVIQKPVEVKLRFGSAKLAAGTKLKIVSRDGVRVTVVYGDETVTVPIENTDIGTALSE